jgi:hypothetical protein
VKLHTNSLETRAHRTCEHCGTYKQRHPAHCPKSREKVWLSDTARKLSSSLRTDPYIQHQSRADKLAFSIGFLLNLVTDDAREDFFAALDGEPQAALGTDETEAAQ